MEEPQDALLKLFAKEPEQWGLRGDPYFWKALKEYFAGAGLPDSEVAFVEDIFRQFHKVTGELLTEDAICFVKEYDKGGMSAGKISGEFWTKKGIPLLKERYHEIRGL